MHASGQAYTVGKAYDAAGRLSRLTYPDGRVISQMWTNTGLLSSIAEGSYLYFSQPSYFAPSGHLMQVTFGNGVTLQQAFNGKRQMSGLTLTNSGTSLLDESFTYTAKGSLSAVTDNLHNDTSSSYTYDQLGRVQSEHGAAHEQFGYDAFGNLAESGGAAFNAHNQFTGGQGFTYDQAGEMTFDGVHRYAYDGDSLITSVDDGAVRYRYDAEGNRVQKQLTDGLHDYVWLGGQLLAEKSPDGSWTDYIYAGSVRIAGVLQKPAENGVTPAPQITYYVTSPLGVTRTSLSATGSIAASGVFEPFGTLAKGDKAAASISFSDEVHDTETGLDTYQYRSYNPRLGRWMSPDPSSEHFARLDNPQTYNLYAFVTNDPLKFTDLHGLSSESCGDDEGCGDWEDDNNSGDGLDDGGVDDGSVVYDSSYGGGVTVVADPDTGTEIQVSSDGGFIDDDSDEYTGDPAPATYHPLPAHDANHMHSLTIRKVSGQNGNPAGHITVQLDSGPEVGFGPAQDMTNDQLLQNVSVPGTIEIRAPGATTIDSVTVYLTNAEMNSAQDIIDARTNNPSNYQVVGQSCVDFGEDVLKSTGAYAPSDTLPSSMIYDIRSQQYAANTTQAP